MSKIDTSERLTFLAEKFDIFETDNMDSVKDKCDSYIEDGWEQSHPIKGGYNIEIIGLRSEKLNKRGFPIVKVSVTFDVFTSMVGADPTPNKICLQWMLNTFVSLIKNQNYGEAARFVNEDLPQANEYLKIFEANKRKKRFKELAKYNLIDRYIDAANINEYRNLSQLYDVVDPFIERDAKGVEKQLEDFVRKGDGLIPFRDRRYTVFIPLTFEASAIFRNFTGWCTAKHDTSTDMFEEYRGYLTPTNEKSNLYIVIDNGFFNGDNENLYQIHFESSQIKDRRNTHKNIDFYDDILIHSVGLNNYFNNELLKSYKVCKEKDNPYRDILIEIGNTDFLFDDYKDNVKIINIDGINTGKKICVPNLPDMGRFSNLTHLIILSSSLSKLHPSVSNLSGLRNLTLVDNKLKEIPSEVSKLKELIFLNLCGNPITKIPDDIKNLDVSMGGSLVRLAINENDISQANYQKLKRLLPNVKID